MTFDAIEVREAEAFIGQLKLTKATRSGRPEPFSLLPHSKKILFNLLGWKRDDGLRQYRRCFASMGRKQAKTQTIAALATHELFRSREMEPEIYMAAKDRDQAAICFDAARSMIESNDYLREMCRITPSKKEIRCSHNGGVMRALSSEGKGKHGYNPSLVIFDEFHTWGSPERELYDALTTGSKTRREPLVVIITTAGSNKETLCGHEYSYAKRVLAGEIQDEAYFPVIYEVPESDDWTDPTVWHKAMPALGTLCKLEDFMEEFRQAQQRPEEQNKFRRLYLNQWTTSETQWLPMDKWDACAEPFDMDSIKDIPCWGGLDLASTRDLTAFSLCWPLPDGRVVVKVWAYLPSDDLQGRCHRDGVRYDLWAQSGQVRLTPGAVTDWKFVTAHIKELREKYYIQSVSFDRWGARDTARELAESGIEVIDFGQGYSSMSPAVKRMEQLVYDRRLIHDGAPMFRWAIDCCTIQSDPAGNIKLVKPARNINSKRIDPAVAAAMAIGTAIIDDRPHDPYASGETAVFL